MEKKFLILIKDEYIKRFEQDLNCSREEVIEMFKEDFGIEHKNDNEFIATETAMEEYLYNEEYRIIKEVE